MSALVWHRPTFPSRNRRVAELIILLWVMSLIDLGFTLWAQACTPFDEQNPIAHEMLAAHHPALVVLMKLGLTAAAAAIFWHARADRRVELVLWALGAMYLLLTLRWSLYTTEVAKLVRFG